VDRKLRNTLKHDKFAEEVGAGVSWLDHHKPLVVRYGLMVLAAVVLIGGIYFYMHYQAGAREEALTQALRIDKAAVGAPSPEPGGLSYATQDEKDKARVKAFSELAAKYHGSEEGGIAQMYMASDAADKADFAGAERMYKDVMDSAPKAISSMARLPLAQVYSAEGKNAEAEKLLREAIANPTVTVSKEVATIHLARMLIKTNCGEARKLLEPLRMERSAVSRAAVTALGETASCSVN
jgi:predicted negative regulator of RcsB-dependent stress response